MFGTKGINTDAPKSAYMGYGIKQVKINNVEVRWNPGKTAFQMIANVEGQPVEDDGFTPDQSSTAGGQVGRVQLTVYMNPNKPSFEQMGTEFAQAVAVIANKLGKREELDAALEGAEGMTPEEYAEAISGVISGEFMWFAITGREYQKQDDKVGVVLGRRRYGFVASLDEGEEHLDAFNKDGTVEGKSNKYDYIPLEKPDSEPKEAVPVGDADGDDLPF